jgi:FkbM family methyltransferase
VLRQASKVVLLNGLWFLMGRANLVRLGRFILNEARLDTGNGVDRNGEGLIQSCVADQWNATENVTVLDIGANIGNWSFEMAARLLQGNSGFRIVAFEPCAETWDSLKANIDRWELDAVVTPINSAVSAQPGEIRFYSLGAEQGRNSVYPHASEVDHEQLISCTSIDEWCRQSNVDCLHYVKIDTEGHDLEVLRGAEAMLSSKGIEMLQFEYNQRWIDAGHFLREAFELLNSYGYSVGKITRMGIEFYSTWDSDLETFQEGNFFAAKQEHLSAFPTVKYWKER